MPLYKKYNFDVESQILIWNITESLEELLSKIQLSQNSQLRLEKMKSKLHQRAFLSVRYLLELAGYNDFDLYYGADGKPYLYNKKNISISHSHQFSGIIISDKKTGIDIEMQRKKIINLTHKFIRHEFQFLKLDNEKEYIEKLTIIWGAKEAIFKIVNKKGISFKNNIQIQNFELEKNNTTAQIYFDTIFKDFYIQYEQLNFLNKKYSLVFAFEKNINFLAKK